MGAREGARALQQARVAAGLTQEELAERAGVSERTVRALESGRALRPHRATLLGLGAALRLNAADADGLVAAWRFAELDILDLFDEAPTEQALRDAVARQRSAIRAVTTDTVVTIGEDRRWRTLAVTRVFDVEADIAELLVVLSYPLGQSSMAPIPEQWVNLEPEESSEVAGTAGRAFLGSLGRRYRAGERLLVGYAVEFGPADPTAPTDDESLYVDPAQSTTVSFQLRFSPNARPARAFRLRCETVDGAKIRGAELPVSPFGVVHSLAAPAAGGVYGIGWEWPA